MARLLFLIAACHQNSGIPFLTENQRNFNTVLFSLCFVNFRVQFQLVCCAFFLKENNKFYTRKFILPTFKKKAVQQTWHQFFVKESRLTTTATMDSSDSD